MDTARVYTPLRRSRPLAIAGVLVAATCLAAWTIWPPRASMAPIAIAVEFGPLADSVPINATLVPAHDGLVSTTTGGTVGEVLVHPGQPVKANDPLLRLSNPDLERQLVEAEGELAAAKADLIARQVDVSDAAGARRLDLIKANNAVQIAQMQYEAESKLQRDGIVSALTLRKTQAERDGAIAERDYARERSAQAGPAGAARLKAATEHVAVLQGHFDSVQASVAALVLRAPFEGVVAKIDGKPGLNLAPGTQVAEVITAQMELAVEVAEQYAGAIRVGQSLRLQNGLRGTFTSIAPVAEGGVIKARATVSGDTGALRSNSTLIGEAIEHEHGNGLFLEAGALDIAGQTLSAHVRARGGAIQTRTLALGPRYGQKTVLLSGAVVDEQVVGMQIKERNP